MSDLRTALESLVLYIEGQDDTHDNCRADECEVASARAALAAPDDRDREVERIAAVLRELYVAVGDYKWEVSPRDGRGTCRLCGASEGVMHDETKTCGRLYAAYQNAAEVLDAGAVARALSVPEYERSPHGPIVRLDSALATSTPDDRDREGIDVRTLVYGAIKRDRADLRHAFKQIATIEQQSGSGTVQQALDWLDAAMGETVIVGQPDPDDRDREVERIAAALAADPHAPQWEACKVCGRSDHWTWHGIADHAACGDDCEVHRLGDRVLDALAEDEALYSLPATEPGK